MTANPQSATVAVGAATAASAIWVDGQRFLSTGSSGHAVALDSDRRLNTAPGPMEMVLRSLCACTATDLVIVLKKAHQQWSRLEVSAKAERAAAPPEIFTRIHLHYHLIGRRLESAVVERAVKLSQTKYCSVSLMLSRSATITYEIAIESEDPPSR